MSHVVKLKIVLLLVLFKKCEAKINDYVSISSGSIHIASGGFVRTLMRV